MAIPRLDRARAYACGGCVVWGAALVAAACGDSASITPLTPPATLDASTPEVDASRDSSTRPDGSPAIDAAADSALPADASQACTSDFPPVADFGAKGPFPTMVENGATNASLKTAACTVYRPSTLGEGGRKHPIVVWSNGTGAPTPAVYAWLLTHWASHGFIVAAANTPNAGTGTEMLTCLDWVVGQSSAAGSPYQDHVAMDLVGTSGHSQGGGGSIMAGRDPRVIVTVPFMAYTEGLGYVPAAATEQHGPMLLMSGGADTIAPPAANQMPVFQSTTVPTFWGTLAGADHVTFALGGESGYLAPSTAWLRLFLMCDDSARAMFEGASCGLCTDPKWTVSRKGIP